MHQRGRSVLEILAVLCVIGILTVGGLGFFSYTIAKNTANKIQKEANGRAAAIMTSPSLNKVNIGEKLTPVGFSRTESVFSWEYIKEDVNAFSIAVEPVKKSTCDILLSMDFTYLKELFVNGKKYEVAVCDKEKNTFKFVYEVPGLKRRPAEVSACSQSGIRCGGGCCYSGEECCQGMCVSSCDGFGMTGRRNAFTCECSCDETLGFVNDSSLGNCVCKDGKYFDGEKCVCENTRCVGGTLTSDCLCRCADGKVHKTGDDRVCVECNEKKDCSSSCHECQNNKCVGECCVENNKRCESDDTCCNGHPCSANNVCCVPNGEKCSKNNECCNNSCIGNLCCIASQGTCAEDNDCCGGYCSKEIWKCCTPVNDTCSSDAECCDSNGSDNTQCLNNICCLNLNAECQVNDDENPIDPCCGESVCQGGKCCMASQGTCERDTDCCGESVCRSGKCCSGPGSDCEVYEDGTSSCCEGDCKNGKCCRPVNDTCSSDEECCDLNNSDNTSCVSNVCCLNLNVECEITDDENSIDPCCGESVCQGGRCCAGAGSDCEVYEDGTSSCCDGSTCRNGVCCSEDGFCDENCDACCLGGKVCSWSVDGNVWTGVCSSSENPVYGLSSKEDEEGQKCCLEGEYLVPSFNGVPGTEGVSKLNETYCCAAEETDAQYTYFNTNTKSCSVLGECPSNYDGIAFIVDVSYSVLFSALTGENECPCDELYYETNLEGTRNPAACGTWTEEKKMTPTTYRGVGAYTPYEYKRCLTDKAKAFGLPNSRIRSWNSVKGFAKEHGFDCSFEEVKRIWEARQTCPEKDRLTVVKEEFNALFSSTDIKWEDLNIGIYVFWQKSKVLLPYGKHSLAELKSVIEHFKPDNSTCTACGLYTAWNDTIANNQKAAPLFFLISDGKENKKQELVIDGKKNYYKLKKMVDLVQDDCDNLFQLHALGYGEIKSAADFNLDRSDNIHVHSINASSLKEVLLSVTKQNLDNCIPREENEVCCPKGTKWDDEVKDCVRN